MLLFVLTQKVTKKVKEGAIAPRALPCHRTLQESLGFEIFSIGWGGVVLCGDTAGAGIPPLKLQSFIKVVKAE